MNRTVSTLISISAAVMVLSAAGISSACVKTIKLSTAFAEGHVLAEFCYKFKEIIEENSNGKISVVLDIGTKTEEEVNFQCSDGTIDMQATGGYPLQEYAPKYFFFNGPYVIKDYAHFENVWNGRLGWEAKKLIFKHGNMLSIGTVYRGLRQMTSNKAISGTDDLINLKLRLPTVPTWVAVWEELETDPVQVPLTELYSALESGLAEASEGDFAQIYSFNLFEVQTHLSITNHLVAVGWITFNKHSIKSFNNFQKFEIYNAAQMASEWATNQTIENESDLLDELQAEGMIVGYPDADAIRLKAKPAVDNLFATEWDVTTWEEVLEYAEE
jgi:TRAP-type C4-dicarboxylate transport system substrate-binding protein